MKEKRKIREFIASVLFESEKKALSRVSYIFCSDDYLLKINREFLQHDDYTDIITFNLSEHDGIKGEIYISVDRVKDNSLLLGINFFDEMLRVIIHGALHLCGYNDKTKMETTIMRERENTYIKEYKKRST